MSQPMQRICFPPALGGLAQLGFILVDSAATNRGAGPIDADGILLRFSGMGYVPIATLIGRRVRSVATNARA
jgi:hypothetical protein